MVTGSLESASPAWLEPPSAGGVLAGAAVEEAGEPPQAARESTMAMAMSSANSRFITMPP